MEKVSAYLRHSSLDRARLQEPVARVDVLMVKCASIPVAYVALELRNALQATQLALYSIV